MKSFIILFSSTKIRSSFVSQLPPTVTPGDDDSTINIVAQVVDTQEENRRQHECDRGIHEHNQDIHEQDQLCQMVDNAGIITTPVVATNSDEELGNEQVTQVPPDSKSPKGYSHRRHLKYQKKYRLAMEICVCHIDPACDCDGSGHKIP